MTSYPITDIGVSAITVAELQYGVDKSNRPNQKRLGDSQT